MENKYKVGIIFGTMVGLIPAIAFISTGKTLVGILLFILCVILSVIAAITSGDDFP